MTRQDYLTLRTYFSRLLATLRDLDDVTDEMADRLPSEGDMFSRQDILGYITLAYAKQTVMVGLEMVDDTLVAIEDSIPEEDQP